MAEVLKSNFSAMLPTVHEAVKNASFIAIDTEFTGLDISAEGKPSLFDSLEDRYKKMKSSASNFIICQLGLTTFRKERERNSYAAQTFIFYLRPHQFGSTDRRFMFQASCIDFLTSYNFDFNKFAFDGIPYLNEDELEKAKKEILDGTLWLDHLCNLGEETKRYDVIASWLDTAEVNEEMMLPVEVVGHEYFQLYAIRWKFPTAWAFIKDNKVVVRKVTVEAREEYQKNVSEEEQKAVDFFIGFGHIFKTLKESEKVIVGHNLLMDLFLIYRSFYKPLPDSFKEFKKNLRSFFPVIYDTKHMWLNVRKFYDVGRISRKSALYELYQILQKPPDNLSTLFCPSVEYVNCENYASGSFPHNAGYDSFLAGWVFIRISHILAIKRTKSLVQVVPQSLKQHLAAVKPFENKVNVSKARVFYVDLAGNDALDQRPHFLYVKMKDSQVPINVLEVERRLRSYGHVELKKIGNSEALVAVGSFACAEDLLRAFAGDQVLYIDHYSAFVHWRLAQAALWLTCIASGCFTLFLAHRFYHLSR